MYICDYGCGQEAKYQFKNGKWCCSKNFRSCPIQRQKNSTRIKKAWKEHSNNLNSISCREKKSISMKNLYKDPNSKLNSILRSKKISNILKKSHKDPNSKFNSSLYKEKQSNIMKEIWKNPNSIFNSILYKNNRILTIEKINKKYPFFSKIEEMRYNPDKPEQKEIQVHCKNHNCKNSKEKGGWFTPTFTQIQNRKSQLENNDGWGGSYFYCSQYCKDTCSLYNVHNDPYRVINKPYTSTEKEVFNKHILKRDNEICYYCGEHATIVHHLRPQKLEPFFALDPDYAISVCMDCHYKYCHPTGSEHSTGNLAKIVCSVESQKFLDQK